MSCFWWIQFRSHRLCLPAAIASTSFFFFFFFFFFFSLWFLYRIIEIAANE